MRKLNPDGSSVGIRASRVLSSAYLDKMGIALGFKPGEFEIVLDIEDMDTAISRQPGYIAFIFCKEAECRAKIVELEENVRTEISALKDLRNELEVRYRVDGLPEPTVKVTETAIAAFVEVSEELKAQKRIIRELNATLNVLRRKLPKLSAAKAAIESKEKALMNAGANKRKEMDSNSSI